MIEMLAVTLAAPIAKNLLKVWLGAGLSAEIGGGIADYLTSKLGKEDGERAATRLDVLAKKIATDLGPLFDAEGLGEDDKKRVAEELEQTLAAAATAKLLVANRLSPGRLYKALLKERPEALDSLDAGPQGLYRRALEAASISLCAVAGGLPHFDAAAAAEQLRLLDAIQVHTETTQKALEPLLKQDAVKRAEMASHEHCYRQSLKRQVRKLRLFGIDLDEDTPADLQLSTAFIPLRASVGDDEKQVPLEWPELLALMPAFGNRLLVEGVAGSGKSTLMQWTIAKALNGPTSGERLPKDFDLIDNRPDLRALFGLSNKASRAMRHSRPLGSGLEEAPISFEHEKRLGKTATDASFAFMAWYDRCPFLVRLRDCNDGRLPEPKDLPRLLATAVNSPTQDWVQEKLRDGSALVVFDGVDEVKDTKRHDIRDCIENYLETYDKTLFIATSRPPAVRGEGWDKLFPRGRTSLLPMAGIDIERFIDHWHAALAEARPATVDEEKVRILKARVRGTPSLNTLAATPLLCAAICYLNRATTGDIPIRADAIFDKLSDLLIHNLDKRRPGDLDKVREALVGLDLKERRSLLAALAYHMVRERESSLDIVTAVEQIEKRLEQLGKADGCVAADIVDALQERSGVLRGRSSREVEFAHNALKTYLAAGVFDEDLFVDLIDKALANADPDLPVLAAAQAGDSTRYRTKLTTKLLEQVEQYEQSGTRNARWRELAIMALRCRCTGPIDTQRYPGLPSRLQDLATQILPPQDLDEAAQLADLGSQIVSGLATREGMSSDTAAACVRCLRLIGTTEAMIMLETYVGCEEDIVVNELAQAVNPLKISKIRVHVEEAKLWHLRQEGAQHLRETDLCILDPQVSCLNLAGTAINRLDWVVKFLGLTVFSLDGTQVTDLAPLKGLTVLKELSLDGTRVTDLAPLEGMTGLETLSLDGTQVTDLAPLKGLTGLERLFLDGTQVTDLAPLEGLTGLETLFLDGTQVADLAPLEGLMGLKELSLGGTQVADFAPLKGLTGLKELSLGRTQVTDLAPLEGMTGLETLSLDGTQVTDLAPLKGLTGLERLFLDGTQVTDLAPLEGLTGLETLFLDGTQVADLAPLEGLMGLKELSLGGTQVADFAPLKGLTGLKELSLGGTQVTDLAPLEGLTGLETLFLHDMQVAENDPTLQLLRQRNVRVDNVWRPHSRDRVT